MMFEIFNLLVVLQMGDEDYLNFYVVYLLLITGMIKSVWHVAFYVDNWFDELYLSSGIAESSIVEILEKSFLQYSQNHIAALKETWLEKFFKVVWDISMFWHIVYQYKQLNKV